MATLTVPYSFVPATSIVASEMNSNFGAVKTFVEALAAGTNLDAGAVTTSKLAAATIQLLAPTGAINAYAGSVAPTGWLLCDGSAVSRATYADLFSLIGTTYGVGDGSTTFNVPNLKGRVIVGRDAAQTEFDTLGETGGAKTHTLTESEIPSHLHADGTLATNSQLTTHNHGSGTLATNSQLTTHSHGSGTLATNSQLGNHQHGVGTLGTNSQLTTHNHTADGTLTVVSSGSHTHGVSDPTHRHTEVSSATGTVTTAYASGTNNFTATGSTEVWSSYAATGISITSTGSDHTHDVSGSTSDANLAHSHGVTGATADANLAHSHSVNSGNTGDANLAHSHSVNAGNTGDANLAHSHDVTGSTAATGGGTAHNNLQPYLVVNYIIKI